MEEGDKRVRSVEPGTILLYLLITIPPGIALGLAPKFHLLNLAIVAAVFVCAVLASMKLRYSAVTRKSDGRRIIPGWIMYSVLVGASLLIAVFITDWAWGLKVLAWLFVLACLSVFGLVADWIVQLKWNTLDLDLTKMLLYEPQHVSLVRLGALAIPIVSCWVMFYVVLNGGDKPNFIDHIRLSSDLVTTEAKVIEYDEHFEPKERGSGGTYRTYAVVSFDRRSGETVEAVVKHTSSWTTRTPPERIKVEYQRSNPQNARISAYKTEGGWEEGNWPQSFWAAVFENWFALLVMPAAVFFSIRGGWRYWKREGPPNKHEYRTRLEQIEDEIAAVRKG